jgi:hypothetical protein
MPSLTHSRWHNRSVQQVEGGVILPDRASLSISAIEDEEYKEDKINWWENVWGYNMKCIKDMAMQEPLVDVVESKAICTDSYEMLVCPCKVDCVAVVLLVVQRL